MAQDREVGFAGGKGQVNRDMEQKYA